MEPKDIAIEGARAGRCAIVGRPNVGKSTLLNALLGQKLAIVTDTPGTTRTCLLGVYASVDPPTQIAFVDTPGITRPKSVLGKALIDQTQSGMLELDALVFVVEPPGKKFDLVRDDDQALLQRVAPEGVPVILAINKVDLAKPKQKLLPYMQAWSKVRDFKTMVPLSALKSENLAPLISEIRALLPEGLQYEDELLTDRPLRYFVAELVREAAIDQTRREVPQGVAVLIEDYEDLPKLARIKATLVVEKKSHKGIIIGAGGQRLKEIGTNAREGIEALIEKKVYLELFVKVVEGWTANPVRVRQMLVGES